MPEITVAITTHNLERFLGPCLEELLSQTFQDFEILVYDDCSTDRTREILENYRSRCPEKMRILWGQTLQGSPARSRNAILGSGEIRGQYLIFLDGDDHLEPDYLEKLHTTARQTGAEITLCAYDRFEDETGRVLCKEMQGFPQEIILPADSVEVRVLTGDSSSVATSVCSRLGIPSDDLVTGAMLAEMAESEALSRVTKACVFAELTPAQKAQIVSLVKLAGHTVGYLGDGVNDVPALVAADIGIVVDSAAVESKEVADLVLLERDLGVVAEGVGEGRKAFANASKYVRIASSSNFGNICSVAAASAFLPFLPATASQLLVLNLSYDAICLAIPWDNVDDEEVSKPKTWSGKGLGGFMVRFGLVSAVFDIVTFAILFFALCPAVCGGPYSTLDTAGQASFVAMFQSGWLLECAWTQSLVVLVLRARRLGGDGGKACRPLAAMVASMLAASALLLLGPAAPSLGLAPMPAWYLGVVVLFSALYLTLVSALKWDYLSRAENLF